MGTILKKPPVFILEEMIDAVDGDRRALEEVREMLVKEGRKEMKKSGRKVPETV